MNWIYYHHVVTIFIPNTFFFEDLSIMNRATLVFFWLVSAWHTPLHLFLFWTFLCVRDWLDVHWFHFLFLWTQDTCPKSFYSYFGITRGMWAEVMYTPSRIGPQNVMHGLWCSLSPAHMAQFSSVTQSCPTPYDPMDCSTPGPPVHHQLPEFTQTRPLSQWCHPTSHSLSYPSPAFNLSQHQGLFKWVSSLHQVAKVLEFQLQHQSFQWIFRIDFLQYSGLENSMD